MRRIKTGNQESEQKKYEDNKMRSQKIEIDQDKSENDTRQIDE